MQRNTTQCNATQRKITHVCNVMYACMQCNVNVSVNANVNVNANANVNVNVNERINLHSM